MKKKFIILVGVLFVIAGLFVPVYAEEDSTFEVGEVQREDQQLVNVDENGNVTPVDTEALEQELAQTPMTMSDDSSKSISVGVVNFRTKASAAYNTLYTEDGTNKQGYLNGYSASDGAFLGYSSDGSKVKFKMAGVTGWLSSSEVQVVDYGSVGSVSYYSVSSGYIYHTITNNINSSAYASKIMVGINPGYLQEGVPYYSYDGHYFYEGSTYASYAKMLNDYRNNTRANSVNSSSPYYNYYEYLSHRSITAYSAAELNNAIASMVTASENSYGRTSKLRNMADAFIENQNKYGTNALLMIGVAANESAWGCSRIAAEKNNLFGHAAYDSDPGGSANGYSSVEYSIYYHSSQFISKGYLLKYFPAIYLNPSLSIRSIID